MTTGVQETLFAFDCGATNWRLYRVAYQVNDPDIKMLGEPQPSPLTSFIDRRLPAIVLLNPEGTSLEGYGEIIQQQLEDEQIRDRIREYFKPCIGSHLEQQPLPHQKRYTHAQALSFTRMLLESLLDQLKQEKWRGRVFDESIRFAFAYPVHWRSEQEGAVFNEFQQIILSCFPEHLHDQVRFVSEPGGAMRSLHRQGLLPTREGDDMTLIADVGGSTTDFIAGQVDTQTGDLEFVRRYGEPHGGGLYDAELAKYLADELKIPASALADDPSALVTLRESGRQLKESLSRQLLRPGSTFHTPQRTITLVMRNRKSFRGIVKLDDHIFKSITRQLNADFEQLIERGFVEMGIKAKGIGQVILVGGGSQLYTIVQHLRKRLGAEKVILADNPAEVVVMGTALEYGKSFLKPESAIGAISKHPPKGKPVSKISQPSWQLLSSTGEIIQLKEGANTVGRKSSNDIFLKDNLASRFHAEFKMAQGDLEIIDFGSTNGTFVNASRIEPNQNISLQAGDQVKIGDSIFTCNLTV